jgi:asparagine synthase (glutamine-hydrolysing)
MPPDRIERALDLMGRRGPDARASHQEVLPGGTVTLLFTRLAIVDLDPRSNQPFADGDLVIAFNGEIYNYVELRAELETLGHVFRTSSDTEVLIQAWAEWGEAALDRLEGMWAFALIDRRAGHLILSRDRFGEKPLHLWQHGDTLYFASEIKALTALAGARPAVDRDQIRRYLVHGYKALYKRPRGWFREIRQVPPASWAAVSAPGPVSFQRYWRLTFRPEPMTEAAAIEGAKSHLETALRIRLRADVPIAFCLSGGIDSTTLAGIAAKTLGQRIHTFSIIDRDERYRERDNIEAQVAFLGCESITVETSRSGFFDRLRAQIAYHDAPVATITYYLHAFLSEAIADHGYRVAISGTAADELFTGYYDHYSMWLAAMAERPAFPDLLNDWRGSYGAYVQNPLLRDPLAFRRDPGQRGHIYLNEARFNGFMVEPLDEGFEETAFTTDLLRNRMLNELFHEAVPVLLAEDDLNSMQYSVENRSPFLDRNLAEFMFTVPTPLLIRDGYAKWLLRAAGAGVVADSVRLDKRKRGFNASIDSLIDRQDPDSRARLLDDGPIFDLVRRDAVERFLDADMTENSFSKFLFSFVSAKLFLEQDSHWNP